MSDRGKRRAHAVETWRLIQIELHRGRNVPAAANEYLLEVCERILGPFGREDGPGAVPMIPDPLMLARPPGNQPDPAYTLGVARAVHARLKAGATLIAATLAVEADLRRLGRPADGSHGGSVEAAYKKHRAQIKASDALYELLARGEPVPEEVLRTALKGNPGTQ